MNHIRTQIFSAVALAASIFLTGCKPSGTPVGGGDTIKVGEFASLNGSEAAFGRSSHNGTLLGVEQVNAAGGVLGKKLELIYEDNQSKDGETATAVKKLISRDKVVAILGEVASIRSLEAAPICQQNKIPQISPSSTNPKVTQIGDYIFRVCFIDPFQGTVMANFATKTLKAKKVAPAYRGLMWGRGSVDHSVSVERTCRLAPNGGNASLATHDPIQGQ